MAQKLNNNSGRSYTEDWLPVRQIMNGMIQLDNGYFVTGVKVLPKNIFIMDQGTQDNTLYNLGNFYNSIDFDFWLIIADRPVDIDVYLSHLQLMYNNAQNNAIKKLIMQDIQKANMFMHNNVVDTEYFLLFKHKDIEVIQKRIRNLINNFANAGLTTMQTSNDDLRMILDNFLNGGQTTTFGTVIG